MRLLLKTWKGTAGPQCSGLHNKGLEYAQITHLFQELHWFLLQVESARQVRSSGGSQFLGNIITRHTKGNFLCNVLSLLKQCMPRDRGISSLIIILAGSWDLPLPEGL